MGKGGGSNRNNTLLHCFLLLSACAARWEEWAGKGKGRRMKRRGKGEGKEEEEKRRGSKGVEEREMRTSGGSPQRIMHKRPSLLLILCCVAR